MLNGLDLFSGIGGISIALEPWVRTVAYCERDRYAQAVLLSRMRSGDIETAPIHDDVRALRGDMLGSWVDIIFGGFPCQDISVAGNGAGLDGERSGLVFEIFRLISECRPKFVFLENVPALAVRGLDRVLLELHALGYDARWTIVSAAEVGAPHLRERIWILAHSSGIGRYSDGTRQSDSHGEAVDNAGSGRHWVPQREICARRDSAFNSGWWATEPDVGRVAHGVPSRVDRIKCLGNSVVPQAAREAFMRLMGIQSLNQEAASFSAQGG